jgi:hypothetical protein
MGFGLGCELVHVDLAGICVIMTGTGFLKVF